MPTTAKIAAIQAAQLGFSPVTQGLSKPVNNGDVAPITAITAVETNVSDVTYIVDPKANIAADSQSAAFGTWRNTFKVSLP